MTKQTKQTTKMTSAEKVEMERVKAVKKVEKAAATKKARTAFSEAKKAYKKATYKSRYTAKCCLHGDIGNQLLPEQQVLYDEMVRTESIWDTLRGKVDTFKQMLDNIVYNSASTDRIKV